MPDPSRLADYNRYMYARGNPLRYNDPTGHCVEDLCIGEGALIAAGCVASGLCEKAAEEGSALLAEASALAVEATEALGFGAETAAATLEPVAENGVEQGRGLAEKAQTVAEKTINAGLDASKINIQGPTNSLYGKLDYLLGEVPNHAESIGKGGFFKDVLGFSNESLNTALKDHLINNFENAEHYTRKVPTLAVTGQMGGQTER